MSRIRFWLKSRGHHLIFGLSIAALISLIIWWSIFIHGSIKIRKEMNLEILKVEMQCLALRMNEDTLKALSPGILQTNPRFEILSAPTSATEPFVKLPSPAAHLIMKPILQVTTEIEEKTQSLNFMLFGESALLILIVLVSILFLYRHIQLERKTTQTVHEFWARSAHQIKTPITGVKTFLQNLKDQAFSPDQIDDYIDLALNQVDKQERLAGSILSGHLLMTEPHVPRNARLELKPFLQKYFTQALHLSDAELHIDWKQTENLVIRGDEEGLKVVLDNLTDNAVKYCSHGLVLDVRVTTDPKYIRVSLCDNGPGFSEKQLPLILEAYKNLHQELPTKNHGSGIGLYLSRRLMRRMGGDLKAESAGPGKGSCFSLLLSKSE